MGRKGTAKGVARVKAILSNTPELLNAELNGILPEGVTETDTEFVFPGQIRLSKRGLENTEGKIYSSNPFDTKFYDKWGAEKNDKHYKEHGNYIPVAAWTYDPDTRCLTLEGWKADATRSNFERWTEHADQIAKYGETKNYDYHIKGYYNPARKDAMIGMLEDRFNLRRTSPFISKSEEVRKWEKLHEVSDMLLRFFPNNTNLVVGSWGSVEKRIKQGVTSIMYIQYKLGEY